VSENRRGWTCDSSADETGEAVPPNVHVVKCLGVGMAQLLPQASAMTNATMSSPRLSVTPEPTCILRWVFRRGVDVLTCAVEAAADRTSCHVCVLPHWNLSIATVERFDAPASALRRHAEIASRLREAGWLTEYGSSSSLAA
jgi:hypothetical protein